MVITSSGVWRGPKTLVLKTIVDDALQLATDSGHKVRPKPWRALDLCS